MKKIFLIVWCFCISSICTSLFAETITFSSHIDGGRFSASIQGTIQKPKGKGPFPAVILMHGCSGLVGDTIKGLQNHADYLREKGFITLILDSFSSRQKSAVVVCSNSTELAFARIYRTYDAYHGLAFLQNRRGVDSKNIFLLGQSNGGSAALLVAGKTPPTFSQDVKFRAIAAYYPYCAVLPYDLISPLLIFGAEWDDWVSPRSCKRLEGVITGEKMNVIIYPKTYHSFDLPMPIQLYAGHTVGGNKEATIDSQKKMLQFFKKHLIF